MFATKTIIYYTSNREDEEFENKIIENLLKVRGNLPIISVSQKPIDLGENICVGDVGQSYLNAFRQLLIGCKEASTPFVVMAESDCLYPPHGYFDFEPTDGNIIYNYNNVWILNKKWNNFYRKEQTHGSIIYGRRLLIDLLENSLKGLPEWSREKVDFPFYLPKHKFQEFGGDPIINIITGANGRNGTKVINKPKKNLQYWGNINDIRFKYLNSCS